MLFLSNSAFCSLACCFGRYPTWVIAIKLISQLQLIFINVIDNYSHYYSSQYVALAYPIMLTKLLFPMLGGHLSSTRPQPDHILETASFPISMANEGARVRIVALRGGSITDRRMTEMGLHVGADLRVLQHQGSGVIVMRGESRFALGSGMAHRVMVTPV